MPASGVNPISGSHWNAGFRPDSGPSRGDPCRRALRPSVPSTDAVRYDRSTSIPAVEFLRRDPRHHHAHHLRVEPANAIGANDKIRLIENVTPDEIQHRPIDLWPLRLHQVENEFRRSVASLVHDPDRRIVTVGNRLDPDFAFEHRVGEVQSTTIVRCRWSLQATLRGTISSIELAVLGVRSAEG